MNDILAKASEWGMQNATRAIAHEKSAEWHRRLSAKLGGIATVLSALVGATIFATITSQLGLDGQGHISLPSGVGSWLLSYAGFVLVLISSPVLTGLQTFLNNVKRQRLDLFLLRYADANTATTKREEALKELEDISKEIEDLCENSLTLTGRACAEAEKELQKEATPIQDV